MEAPGALTSFTVRCIGHLHQPAYLPVYAPLESSSIRSASRSHREPHGTKTTRQIQALTNPVNLVGGLYGAGQTCGSG